MMMTTTKILTIKIKKMTSWWFQPISKILDIRQIGSFPQVGVKIEKYLSCHHPDDDELTIQT